MKNFLTHKKTKPGFILFLLVNFLLLSGFKFSPELTKPVLMQKINAFLTEITTFQANFLQETSEGIQEGILFIERPGKMRLEYALPSSLLMIAKDGWVIQYNKNTGQSDQLLIDETPAAFLLSNPKDFTKNFSIQKWRQTPGLVTLEITSKAIEDLGITLTLVFQTEPFALKQWIIEDATGYQTKVTLFNWIFNSKLNKSLFFYKI